MFQTHIANMNVRSGSVNPYTTTATPCIRFTVTNRDYVNSGWIDIGGCGLAAGVGIRLAAPNAAYTIEAEPGSTVDPRQLYAISQFDNVPLSCLIERRPGDV